MERWATTLQVTLIVLMVVTVWRVWVLGRQVRLAGEAVRSSRTYVNDRNHEVATPLSVYPVDVHVASAASPVTVQKIRPDKTGGTRPVTQAIPLLLRNSPASVKFGDDVAQGYVTYAVAGSVLFEALPGWAWSGAGDKPWSRPDSSDVLVWAKPLTGESAKKFPFPTLREDSSIQLGNSDAGGYALSLVMAF